MGLGFPEIAKLGLAVVVLVIVGLEGLVWFMVRLVRRLRAAQLES